MSEDAVAKWKDNVYRMDDESPLVIFSKVSLCFYTGRHKQRPVPGMMGYKSLTPWRVSLPAFFCLDVLPVSKSDIFGGSYLGAFTCETARLISIHC